MSVQLTGTYGWFTREGLWIGEYNRVALLYGSALTNAFNGIWAQYATSDQEAVANLPDAVNAFRVTGQNYQSILAADAQLSSLLQVSDDTSVVPYTTPQSLSVLRCQMVTAVASINRPTLTSTVTPNVNNLGDTLLVVSTTNIYGDPLDMTYNETWAMRCTSQQSGFAGTITATGELAVNVVEYNWPQGSGASTTLSILDPAADGLSTDGGFANWTGTGSNTPVSWEIANGDPGVTVFRSTDGVRPGTFAAQITSDGAQATQLYQDVSLTINTVYAVTFQAKINSLTATGVFRIALTDGDGNVMTDDTGTSLSYTRNVNGQVGTAYAQFTAFFSTPRQLPVSTRLYVGTSTAATAARVITFDLVGMVAATPLYGNNGTGTAGPFAAAFANTEPSAVNDTWNAVFTNSLTTKSFVWGLERIMGMRNLGIYFPSSGSPTISDSLVSN